jgi:hypothetical protein
VSSSSSSRTASSSAASSTDVSMLSKSCSSSSSGYSWLSADRRAAPVETSGGEYENPDLSLLATSCTGGGSRSRLVQSLLLFPGRSVKARSGTRHHCAAPTSQNVFNSEQIYLDMNSRTLPSQFSYCTLRNFK